MGVRPKRQFEDYALANQILRGEAGCHTTATYEVLFLEPAGSRGSSEMTLWDLTTAPHALGVFRLFALSLVEVSEEFSGQLEEWSSDLEERWKGWSRESLFHPETPFSQLEQLHELEFDFAIFFIRKCLNVPFADSLAKRIENLLQTVKEEEPELSERVSIQSLRNFGEFLQKHPDLREPSVFLTPSGNFRAKWRLGTENHFAVEFLPSRNVRYVLFAPDLKRTEGIARTGGITSQDALLESVKPYQVQRWICQE